MQQAGTSISRLESDRRLDPREQVRAVAALTLPAIVGTGFFIASVILTTLFPGGGTSGDPFRESVVQIVVGFPGAALYFACYFGATVGPVFVPLAAYQAFAITRRHGLRSAASIQAWILVVLAATAAVTFYGWITRFDIYI